MYGSINEAFKNNYGKFQKRYALPFILTTNVVFKLKPSSNITKTCEHYIDILYHFIL